MLVYIVVVFAREYFCCAFTAAFAHGQVNKDGEREREKTRNEQVLLCEKL